MGNVDAWPMNETGRGLDKPWTSHPLCSILGNAIFGVVEWHRTSRGLSVASGGMFLCDLDPVQAAYLPGTVQKGPNDLQLKGIHGRLSCGLGSELQPDRLFRAAVGVVVVVVGHFLALLSS
ncbi:hypothetical protein LZ30DRAFT_688122 [Colletotrichum cereale]|nr:hypothetical protein LZ30DRAFT_688122 [Colletotrichum cereale]